MAVRRNGCRYILSCGVSDTKPGYKPLHLFEEARRVAGVDPWIFITDGLTVFVKAASKAFRRREGFRLMHIRDIHLKNIHNLYERLNGEFKDYIKTTRGFKLKDGRQARWRMSRPVAVACRAPQLFQTPRRPRRQDAG